MDTQIVLQQDIDTSIERKVDPVELATVVYPRIQFALEQAKTPEEVSTLRAQIEAVQTYIKSELPKAVRDRKERFKTTFDGDMLYCEASAKLGGMWGPLENKAEHGGDRGKNQYREWQANDRSLANINDYFASSVDATRCVRAGRLGPQDRKLYYEEQRLAALQPTVNGLERKWSQFFRPDKTDTPSLPDGTFRVFYADPPWKYSDAGVITGNDAYGRAERHYPTMSIEELCALPIAKLAQDDAVLFLWVTSPMLEDSFEVIKAWGFKYKTSFVWDKVKHNFGHYNSVRHEFLLVCTRGSCTPDTLKLYDSVQTIERSSEHSEKPEEFRSIIDTLYPDGERIELFARDEVDGWNSWGNEAG